MNDTIEPPELNENVTEYKIIDIRKDAGAQQIPGSLLYNGEALETSADLPFDKNDDVVLYCGSGNSCSRAAQNLRERGYKARALKGGYKAWCDAGLPLEDIGDIREF